MDGNQGRRTGSVNRHRRASKAQDIGEATGGRASRVTRCRVDVALLAPRRQVTTDTATNEDADLLVEELCGYQVCRFQRLPGCLQQQAMCRVHHHHFAWRKAKEGGIKLVHPREKTTARGINRLGFSPRSQVDQISGAVGRQFDDAIKARHQLCPKGGGGINAARVVAGHANNRNRPVSGRLRRRGAPLTGLILVGIDRFGSRPRLGQLEHLVQ